MSKKQPLFAFFGTPRFAKGVLDALERRGLLPALVITAPERQSGRGLERSPSSAHAWALERGIDVLTPESLKDESLATELANTDWDLFVVAAYAKRIPQRILDIPRRGSLNVHPSLLPKLRGASPVYSAILSGERQTGVSIMQMTDGMDAGPVVAQARIEISEEDWPLKGSILLDLLASEGGELLADTMAGWIAGEISAEPQDDSKATYTKKFSDQDAVVDLLGDPATNLAIIRAFDSKQENAPQRAHFFTPQGKRVIITEAHLEDNALIIDRVIPEGKKEMPYEDFMRSRRA